MRHSRDDHNEPLILDDVEDPIVAHPCSPHVIGAAKLHRVSARIACKPVDPPADPTLHCAIELRQGTRGRGQELDGVHRAGLELQASLELLPGDPVAVGGIAQRRSHVVQVAGVLD